MEVFEKETKKCETNILQKSGNIRELLKAGKNSNINLDISRLSGKGFSNLLEKAKKLQELKIKEEKSILENKKENNEMMENMMDYNEGNNFGLLSSANDDEMKFKPSYQIKNNNDNINFREYEKNQQNYNNH